MIDHQLPKDWKDLQDKAGLILKQAGFEVQVEKKIETVRSEVEIDVYAIDKTQSPEIVYLCECKYWDTSIPQAQVHAFRTVIADYGANFGLFISKAGFQKGAYEAAEKTNIRLVDWFQFQELFKQKWIHNFADHLYEMTVPLVDYSEPVNGTVEKRAESLSAQDYKTFQDLKRKYFPFASFGPLFKFSLETRRVIEDTVKFPFDPKILGMPGPLINSYMELESYYAVEVPRALAEFDELFKEEFRMAFRRTNIHQMFAKHPEVLASAIRNQK